MTTHQKAVLIQVLLSFPDQHVGVCYDPSASDALDFAKDFLTIFKVIGWKVKAGSPSEALNGQFTGLRLVAGDQDDPPPGSEALRDALRIYGIEVTALRDPTCNINAGGFILSVGCDPER